MGRFALLGFLGLACAGSMFAGCSSDSSSATADAGCSGPACGNAGAGGGGTGGAGRAGTGGVAIRRFDAGACKPLDLAAGETTPEGALVLWAPPSSDFASPIALADGYVYFWNGTKLLRVPTGGGPAETLRAVDRIVNAIYVYGTDVVWMAEPSNGTPRLWRAPIGSDSAAPVLIADVGSSSSHVTADGTAVYWQDRADHTIKRAPVAGSGVTSIVTNAEISGDVIVGSDLYYLDFNTHLLTRVPVTGGAATQLVSYENASAMGTDGTSVYWADHNGYAIYKWSTGDTQAKLLRSMGSSSAADSPAAGVTAGGGFVYWPGGFFCVGVFGMRDDGTEPKLLARGMAYGSALVMDAQYLYTAPGNGVFRIPR